MATFTIDNNKTTMQVTNCIKCATPFAFAKTLWDRQQNEGGWHFCPICGQSQGWDKGTVKEQHDADLAQLKSELYDANERARRAKQDADHFKKSRDAFKGRVTQLKNRAAAGICPCCNEKFIDLEKHMASVHPEFLEIEEPAAEVEPIPETGNPVTSLKCSKCGKPYSFPKSLKKHERNCRGKGNV